MSKGTIIFLGIVIASILFCGVVPFMLLPSQGIAMGLPAISVPGETLWDNVLGSFRITNTLVGTLIADVFVLAFALGATRKLKEIPGRLQGLFEMLTDALYGVAKSTAGSNAAKIFPLMATIFLFLLLANWMELIPGVDSVGLMHCAEGGISGYPRNGITLEVSKALDAGTKATEADYEACHAKEHGTKESAESDTASTTPVVAGAEVAGAEAATAATAVRDDIYVVTPFVRAAATDLNLTMALALLAVIAIQVYGVRSLGMGYFSKFINIPALDKIDKNPMGAMDFGVGFLEIISEISRIISFGFRLFGNIFAGQVLLFVIPFLAGALLPLGIYGFELFVGVIQAFVFAMLVLVFASMAMAGHEHEESHE